jgi:hypothetical protein
MSGLGRDENDIQALAMVLLYSGPDPIIYQKSFRTVYSVTQLEGKEGLRVICVKDIISVVSMQPHSHHIVPGEKRWFVWEKIGLELHMLRGDEENMDVGQNVEGTLE